MKTLSALAALSLLSLAAATPAVASPWNAACPPMSFANNTNYARNPSFESPSRTPVRTWHNGDATPAASAAPNWVMHSSNAGATITSRLIPTTVPQAGGSKMLRITAGGNEGGIMQDVANAPRKLMLSAWVKVTSGHVALQTPGNSGPVAWSTKHGEWEQLRVCTDGTGPTNALLILNQDPNGGDFVVDRVEARAIP